jgi:hypothetical protein
MRIDHGKINKQATWLTVWFERPFDHTPNVVVTSAYVDEVGHFDTIDVITNDYFVVGSDNGASNYYVEWVAVSDESD